MQNNIDLKVERLYKLNTDGKMKAFVDLSVNDALLIKGLRIIEGTKGAFVSMPKMQGKDKKWYDIIEPRQFNNEVQHLG